MPTETVNHPDRRIVLEAVHNFRDLGGYPTIDGRITKWRRIFRADGLQRLTSADLTNVKELDVRTVIDLRSADELSERGTFPVDLHEVDFHHLPIIDATWDPDEAGETMHDEAEFLLAKYHLMLREGGRRVGRAIGLVSAVESGAVVFHCAAGKDRTGIVAALLLAGLGVSDELIELDYAMSADAAQRVRTWVLEQAPEYLEQFSKVPPVFFAAHPDAIGGLLRDLREDHGSIREYCRTIGVESDAWERLEKAFLTTPN